MNSGAVFLVVEPHAVVLGSVLSLGENRETPLAFSVVVDPLAQITSLAPNIT